MEELTLSQLFEKYPLVIGVVADMSGMNQSLLRQYVSGFKIPSKKQLKKIEATLKVLGSNLEKINVYGNTYRTKRKKPQT